MGFRYSLQKVVDLKNNERTQAEWMLSAALSKLHMEETQLNELQTNKQQVAQSLTEAALNCAKVSDLVLLQQYLSYVEQQIETKDEHVKQAQHHVVHSQDVLTDKLKDQKIWDKAKDKARHIYQTNVLKKEQEQLDEIVTMRYNTP